MLKQMVCLGALLTVATSCTIKPGEYRVYRVALHGVSLGCQYKNPDNFENDNYFQPAILAIYATDDNTYFLEDGADAFVGTRSGKDFTFLGDYLHQQRFDRDEGYSRDFETLETLKTTYGLSVNNKEIFGLMTQDRTYACSGSEDDCDQVSINDRVCTDVLEVFGTEVDEADVEFLLGGAMGGAADGGV